MRLVGDRGELLVGVLLRAGRGAVRHHPARRGHLDQLGAVPDLVTAHARTSSTPLAMPSATDSGMMPGRQTLEHRGVEVSAVGGDGVPGREDARPVVPALVDRALQRDVEQVAARLHHQPEVAHGRETGLQRGACVDRAAQGAVRGVVLHAVHRVGQTLRDRPVRR